MWGWTTGTLKETKDGLGKGGMMTVVRHGGEIGTRLVVAERAGTNLVGGVAIVVKTLIVLLMTVHGNPLLHGNPQVEMIHTANATTIQGITTPTRIRKAERKAISITNINGIGELTMAT